MDDPWPAVFTTILALVLTAAFSGLGSIGISRTTLERLHEEKIARAGLYLWLYRSRDFVSQMVLLGQTIAISTGTLALLSLFFQPPIAAGFWQYLGAVWSVALLRLSRAGHPQHCSPLPQRRRLRPPVALFADLFLAPVLPSRVAHAPVAKGANSVLE